MTDLVGIGVGRLSDAHESNGGLTLGRRVAACLVAIIAGLFIAGCSDAEALTERPSEYHGLTSQEVGCTLQYGDAEPMNTGLITPSIGAGSEPNDWTTLSVRRSEGDIITASYEDDRSQSRSAYAIDELPDHGVLLHDAFVDQGHPGFVIACWRGEA